MRQSKIQAEDKEAIVPMEAYELQQLQEEICDLNTKELLAWAAARWNLLLASSMSAEDQVLWDLLWQNFRDSEHQAAGQEKAGRMLSEPKVVSLDTGRLPQETYDCIQASEKHYGIRIELLFPEAGDLQRLQRQGGPNLFYQGQMQRKLCCKLRKVEPLRKRLKQHVESGSGAWLSGQRRSQSITRSDLQRIEWDEQFGLIKLNPMADWQSEEVWAYIREHALPYNALHDKSYPSIGCEPCTRAVQAGEDERSGRWWWESAEKKECGIHIGDDGKLQRG